MKLTLKDERDFTLPLTLTVDPAALRPGTPIRVGLQRRNGADLVTGVQIATGIPR